MHETIKQILPIPEGLTAMTRHEDENGKEYYFDAKANGETVLYALVNDEDGDAIQYYTADYTGMGELEDYGSGYVRLTPTVHCQKCGRRMLATTTPITPETVVYRCICGESMDERAFWDIMESCEKSEGQ